MEKISPATWKHFSQYANEQRASVKEKATAWNLFKTDSAYYEREGWPTLFRDVNARKENPAVKKKWTPAARKAFAAKMKAARAAKARTRRANPHKGSAPKVHTKAFDRCVTKVKRRRRGKAKNAFAVCQSALGKRAIVKRHRRRNRMPPSRRARYYIMAQKGKGSKLYYDGRHFTARRNAKGFITKLAATETARALMRQWPALDSYKVYVAHVA